MSQTLSLENGSLKVHSLFYPLAHITLFSARSPEARANEGRGQHACQEQPRTAEKWRKGLTRVVGHPGCRSVLPQGMILPEAQVFQQTSTKHFFNVKSPSISMLATELHVQKKITMCTKINLQARLYTWAASDDFPTVGFQ